MLMISSDATPVRDRHRRKQNLRQVFVAAGHDHQYQLLCRGDPLSFRDYVTDLQTLDERLTNIRRKVLHNDQWQVGTLLMRPVTMPLSAEGDRPLRRFPRTTTINPQTLEPEVQIMYAICFYEVMQVAYQESFADVLLNPGKTTIYSDIECSRSMSASDMVEVRIKSLCVAIHHPNSFYTEIPFGNNTIHFVVFDGSIANIVSGRERDSIQQSYMEARATFNTIPATFTRMSELSVAVATTPASLPLEIVPEALPGGLSPYIHGATDPIRQPQVEFKESDSPHLLAEEITPFDLKLDVPFEYNFNPFEEPDYTEMLLGL